MQYIALLSTESFSHYHNLPEYITWPVIQFLEPSHASDEELIIVSVAVEENFPLRSSSGLMQTCKLCHHGPLYHICYLEFAGAFIHVSLYNAF